MNLPRPHVLLFIFGLLIAFQSSAQEVTSRDTIYFTYRIRSSIIPELELLMNSISSTDLYENEVPRLIERYVNSATAGRLFYDEKVVIENDLNPGADTDPTIRGDMKISDYLTSFYTLYAKSDVPTIVYRVTNISPLKSGTYLYYNVQFECTYSGKTTNGKSYRPFSRTAEISITKTNDDWDLLIRSIRFSRDGDLNRHQAVTSIRQTDTDVDKIVKAFSESQDAKKALEAAKVKQLTEEGDDLFADKRYEEALKKYREARMTKMGDKAIAEKIDKTRAEINKLRQEEQRKQEISARIQYLREDAVKNFNNYNFTLSKTLCDSLLHDYEVSDPEIIKLNDRLTDMNTYLAGITAYMENRQWKEAIKKCESAIASSPDSVSRSEFHYRLARVYFNYDKTQQKPFFENAEKAIALSGRRHQDALKLRSEMHLYNNNLVDAIEDATRIVNNDSRNYVNYTYRASVYELAGRLANAIADYRDALKHYQKDELVYLNKARLEWQVKNYSDLVLTTGAGIEHFKSQPKFYYYRGLAKIAQKKFTEAGEDFRSAKSYGLPEADRDQIMAISDSLVFVAGTQPQNKEGYLRSLDAYSIAITVDSSQKALFNRGYCYLQLSRPEDAVNDFVALERFNQQYEDLFYRKGEALLRLGKFEQAVESFDKQLVKTPSHYRALILKGEALMEMKQFVRAGSSYEKAGMVQFSDSVFYLSSLAFYHGKNYTQSIAMSNQARINKTKIFEVYKTGGDAHMAAGNYSTAVKEYEKALELKNNNDSLLFVLATAREAARQFTQAAEAYERLSQSAYFNDTALFRGAVCMIKSGASANLNRGMNKLNKYLATTSNTDKREASAWMAYCYLTKNEQSQADSYLNHAGAVNEDKLPVVYFVLACKKSRDRQFDEAFRNLEKTITDSHYFSREDIEQEEMLKNIRKDDRFKVLLANSFK